MPASPRAYAAIDLGASSGRVILGIAASEVVALEEVHRFPNRVVEIDGVARWDFPSLFAETLTGLATAQDRIRETGAEFAGIGVDSWGVDWVYVRQDDTAELPARAYRGAQDPAPVLARRRFDGAEAYRRSGVIDHAINSALRMGADAAGRSFMGEMPLFTPDLWAFWLTGKRGSEPTIASTSQLLDVHTGLFDPELLAAVGAEGLALPPMQSVGSLVGSTTPEVSARIGARHSVPVFRVAGHDTASAFAFAAPDAPEALISSGTWSLVGAARSEPETTDAARHAGFTNERGARGVLVMRNLTGLWMLQECAREWGDDVSLPELFTAVERLPFDARTFDVADPRLFGAGSMETRIRALCAEAGRPLDAAKLSIVGAVIDSLAAGYADGVRATAELVGAHFERVRIVGGGSQNAALCRRTAELTGRPVIAGPVEATAIGNLAVQLHADGLAPTIDAAYRWFDGGGALRTYAPPMASADPTQAALRGRHTAPASKEDE